ncbi:hypothetical protein AgCh_035407 [Apium graveolens]
MRCHCQILELGGAICDMSQLAIITNRKTVDQHIVLFDCSTEDKEVVMIEFLNDLWTPRIDFQGNGEDNIIIGLSIDNVSQDKQAKINFGEENEVLPCCVLVCLTVDGKLTFFHFASAIGNLAQQEANCTNSVENVPVPVPTEIQLSEVLPKADEQKREAEGTKETAADHKSVIKDLKNTESRTNAEVISKADTFPEKFKTGISDRAVRNDVPNGFGGHGALPQTGASAVQDTSFKSISSGPSISSSPAEGRSSIFSSSKFQMNQSNANSTTHVQPQNQLPSKDFVSSFNSTPHMNKPQGNVECSPQSRSPQVPSREKFVLESSSNPAATATNSRLPSSKGLGEEMTKELDVLFEHIEGLGGFGDASMSEQKNSVALDKGFGLCPKNAEIGRDMSHSVLIALEYNTTISVATSRTPKAMKRR